MTPPLKVNIQEENDLDLIFRPIKRYYYLFIIGVVFALGLAYLKNKTTIPLYQARTSIRILKNKQQQNIGDYINSSLFGTNQNLSDELLAIKSSKIVSQTINNLGLPVTYYYKNKFLYIDAYKNVPFKLLYQQNHVQPLGVKFEIRFTSDSTFAISAEGENVSFYNYDDNQVHGGKRQWEFNCKNKVNQLIENNELSFIVEIDSLNKDILSWKKTFYFDFNTTSNLTNEIKGQLSYYIIDPEANAIGISILNPSLQKGIDILDGITDVYAKQNLEKKNYLASITIEYIDKQIGEISDSLNKTEKTLQQFKSSNQLINGTDQASGIAVQYRELGNQRAILMAQKKYFEYILDYLNKNEDISNIVIPNTLGIQDPLLTTLINQLLNAQAQKKSLIDNNQEKNPAVKKYSIQIENTKNSIIENISNNLKTTEISLDDLNKRINKTEAEISKIPNTERLLTGIERKYRLNDAIYNNLMEKLAEAKITKASNMPDNEILEPAQGWGPVSPDKKQNYLIAFVLGLVVPFVLLQIKNLFNNKIETQEQIEKITDNPVLGKIPYSNKKSQYYIFDSPNSPIAEAFRALRTNLEYYIKGNHKKVIIVTSNVEGEGKSFNAMNIATSYALLGKRTILLDFDLRKQSNFINGENENLIGISSYLANRATLEDIIIKSPYDKLHYISSGPIPPNPVELIAQEKTQKLFLTLKEIYDYIIIDTPPLAQVTDGYLLMDFADLKIIITRYSYTPKKTFNFIVKDLKNKGIENYCVVLNSIKSYKDQYGYGYGYHKTKKRKWIFF
jgi:tyrosine-protein kinase Etk/Wzc